jgi:hypothetical protein
MVVLVFDISIVYLGFHSRELNPSIIYMKTIIYLFVSFICLVLMMRIEKISMTREMVDLEAFNSRMHAFKHILS